MFVKINANTPYKAIEKAKKLHQKGIPLTFDVIKDNEYHDTGYLDIEGNFEYWESEQ